MIMLMKQEVKLSSGMIRPRDRLNINGTFFYAHVHTVVCDIP